MPMMTCMWAMMPVVMAIMMTVVVMMMVVSKKTKPASGMGLGRTGG